MARHQVAALWLALNGLAAAAYLCLASAAWVEPELAAVPAAHGGGAVVFWGLTALPLFVSCTLLNLGVLAWAARGGVRSGRWRATRLAWRVPAVWLTALVIDLSRH